MFENGEQKESATLIDALFKSKYADLIIVSAIVLTFLVLINIIRRRNIVLRPISA